MTLNDVIAFAKAGWTPADVKEIMKTSSEQEKESTTVEDKEKESTTVENKEKESTTVEDKEEESTTVEDKIDYKALYEAEQQKVKDIQKANTKRDIKKEQDNKSDFDIVADFARSFM